MNFSWVEKLQGGKINCMGME